MEVFYFVCGVLLLGTATTAGLYFRTLTLTLILTLTLTLTTAGLYFIVPTVEDGTAQLAGVTVATSIPTLSPAPIPT